MSHADVVITGGTGMLGRELVAACRRRHLQTRPFAGRRELDITDPREVRRVLDDTGARLVINAAGYTDVDGAETDPAAAELANHTGPATLARACRDAGATLVHYSTDYVFDGRAGEPYRVEDPPAPINVYGRTKHAGDRAVAASGCTYLLIRTSWLYAAHGRNFVRTILDLARKRPELDVVDDQTGRPTYTVDLAGMTLDLLDHGAEGTFHAANDGRCTWFELATTIVALAGLECVVRPCTPADYPLPARRPESSVLDLSTTIDVIGRPRHWKQALAECLNQLAPQGVTGPHA